MAEEEVGLPVFEVWGQGFFSRKCSPGGGVGAMGRQGILNLQVGFWGGGLHRSPRHDEGARAQK